MISSLLIFYSALSHQLLVSSSEIFILDIVLFLSRNFTFLVSSISFLIRFVCVSILILEYIEHILIASLTSLSANSLSLLFLKLSIDWFHPPPPHTSGYRAHFVLLLCISGNFWLDAFHCSFHIFECLDFVVYFIGVLGFVVEGFFFCCGRIRLVLSSFVSKLCHEESRVNFFIGL